MENVLKNIISNKLEEVSERKKIITDSMVRLGAETSSYVPISMRHSIENSKTGIIAEFKRRSPSKGWINTSADVETIVGGYLNVGTAACSVLTDTDFFGGSLSDLISVRTTVGDRLPLLRKEFIIDPYQIYEARVAGADAILLIAACLTPNECELLARTAHQCGLEVLLEIHSEQELSHLNPYVDMLGVNNRNLDTFVTDTANSFRLSEIMKRHTEKSGLSPLLISESGLSDPRTVSELRMAGFKGFLMGETFMKTQNPSQALKQFISQLL